MPESASKFDKATPLTRFPAFRLSRVKAIADTLAIGISRDAAAPSPATWRVPAADARTGQNGMAAISHSCIDHEWSFGRKPKTLIPERPIRTPADSDELESILNRMANEA